MTYAQIISYSAYITVRYTTEIEGKVSGAFEALNSVLPGIIVV